MKILRALHAMRRLTMGAEVGKLLCVAFLAVPALSPLKAKEVSTVAQITSTGDWILGDRNDWLLARKNSIASMIPGPGIPGIRFLNAFAFNVKNDRANDYATVGQRHAFYDALSYTLHFATDVPQALRCVRFFDAAADVTHTFNVGVVEFGQIIKEQLVGISADTENLLIKINGDLFARNFKLVEKMMLTWREPRDPLAVSPTQRIDALDFDLRMVTFEQGEVETFLAANPSLITAKIKSELSTNHDLLLRFVQLVSGQGGAIDRTLMFHNTWLPAAGVANFDFFRKSDRIALGEAYVFFLHGYDLDKYKAYRTEGTKPSASCKGVLPGLTH